MTPVVTSSYGLFDSSQPSVLRARKPPQHRFKGGERRLSPGVAAERLPFCAGDLKGDRLFSVLRLHRILAYVWKDVPEDSGEEEKTTTLAKKDGTREARKRFSRRLRRAEENPDSL